MAQPESPSRFKLGMYRKNMVLEPPRRNNLTLKWESNNSSTRRAASTEKRPKNAIINQFMNDYSSVRPGPTCLPQSQARNRIGKSAVAPVTTDTMFVTSLRD